MRTTKQMFALCLFASVLFYFSCKKTDAISTIENLSTNSIEEKFFNSHRTTDPTENALIGFLKRVHTKDKFVEKTVAKIGYPRWDKAITNAKKKRALNARNLLGDSIQTFYIPFVRDSQNYVNASMIIHASQTDTTFTYRCDWQYSQLENNIESANDAAEHFATFFMVLDKAVFGYSKFNIVDSNLFRTSHGPTKYVRLDSTASSTVNNFYDLVEFCQDVVYFYQNCTYGNTNACSEGCDQCYLCMDSFVMTYCWEEYVWMGGSGGGTGGTGSGGGGTGGGGSTPPDCGVIPVDPLVAGRVVDPCDGGPGWTPVPIDDEPPYDSDLDPASYPESTEILLFEQDYRGQMSSQELAIFDGLIRYQQLQYLFNAKAALDWAQSLYPNSVLNGNGDAFHHAYFSALNAKVLGVNLAKQLGDAHETFPNSNQLENTMDLFNNQYGRDLFVTLSQNGLAGHGFKELVNGLLRNHKIPNGELKRLSPLGPNSEIILTTQLVPTN